MLDTPVYCFTFLNCSLYSIGATVITSLSCKSSVDWNNSRQSISLDRCDVSVAVGLQSH